VFPLSKSKETEFLCRAFPLKLITKSGSVTGKKSLYCRAELSIGTLKCTKEAT